jgi:hypothetical protein
VNAIPLLLLMLALLVVLLLPAERSRIWNGLKALAHVFGPQFVVATLGVAALLVWALWHQYDALVAVAGLICVLLAIRAHDIGELELEEPSEYQAFWAGKQWSGEDIRRMQHAPPLEFNRITSVADYMAARVRNQAALGAFHDPVSL